MSLAVMASAQSQSTFSSLPPISPSSAPAIGFTTISAADAGIRFTNQVSSDRYLTNQIYLNGSGLALGDVDGDGRPDVFLAAAGGGSRLFGNLGNWKFADHTEAAFPPGSFAAGATPLDATGAVLADLDGDGDLDLVFNTVGQGTYLFFNDGRGRFTPSGSVLNAGHAGTSLALADVDGDGDLDLYITNYRPNTIRDDPAGKFTIRDEGGRQRVMTYNGRSTSQSDLAGRFYITPAGVKENGEPDAFYLNDGQGRFTLVEWTGGAFLTESGKPLAAAPYDWGLSVLFRDLTGDGRPDLYISNDFESPDRFWINETSPGGPVRFRAAPVRSLRHTSAFAMGADAADVNRDGHDDFLVLDMLSRDHRQRNYQVDALPMSLHEPGVIEDRPQFAENTFFLNRGDGTYAELGRFTGLAASEWSWTPVFLDVDLDGYEDLLISNGHELDMMDADASQRSDAMRNERRLSPRELLDLRKLFSRFAPPNAAFRNEGNLRFSDTSVAWHFDVPNVTQGMALADLDGDGDLDVVQNNLNAPPSLLRNDARTGRILVRARAAGANTHGIGTRIVVNGGPVAQQSQIIMSGGRYLSSDDAARVFAAGKATELSVQAIWPSGKVSVVSNVPPNSVVSLTESDATPAPQPDKPKPTPWFADLSSQLRHGAGDSLFNDFERQPLLPWSAAYPAPGASWIRGEANEPDQLLIGTGAGGSPALFRIDGGEFQKLTNAALARPVARDLTTVVMIGRTLLAGSSNYRDGRTNGGLLRLYDLDRGVSGESLLGQASSVGPLAVADVDGDGSLEIFVGGRAIAGRYPEAAASVLLKSEGGRFKVVQRWDNLGLVNSASFADFDGDGRPDLLLAAEWGGLQLLHNQNGQLEPWEIKVQESGVSASPTNLKDRRGWWTSVAVADFDGDGRLDFAAGNRGWNWFPVPRAPAGSEPSAANRRRLRFGDLDGNGTIEIIESYFQGERELPLRRADFFFTAFPQLRETFKTRAEFGGADIGQLLQSLHWPQRSGELQADYFATSVFLNRGDTFEQMPLPLEAQFAPVSGLAAADFDGDGKQDVFLAQNFFPVRPDEARQDGGCGLILKGDGAGRFAALPPAASGIHVWGDARAAAVGDFNLDGRPDLVVTQNAGPTMLFRNDFARPGLEVRLVGSPANDSGIGTQMRLSGEAGKGPVQEVIAGSGWLSIDSPQRILTSPHPYNRLEIRWPGESPQTLELPAGAVVVEVNRNKTLRVLR